MANRLLLLAIIIGLWSFLKLVDCLVIGPAILFLLFVAHTFWLLTAQRRWRKGHKTRHVMAGHHSDSLTWQPSVDILVPAKNEARVIESCVRNLFQLDYPNYQVWVIDDSSTDRTPEILNSLKAEFPRLRVIHRNPASKPGKSAALNEALPLSKGELIAVFDADAHVEPDFLKSMLTIMIDDQVGAVQSQKKIFAHQQGFLVNCQDSEYALDTYFQMGRDLIGGAVELRGNGQLIRRTALIDVGGWNNNAITDDLDLACRLLILDWDVRFCPEAVVYEEGVTNLKALLRQRKRWAEGSIRRYLDYIFPLNSPSRLSLVERLDILAFVAEFSVPALVFLALISEAISWVHGGPTHISFLMLLIVSVLLISQFNFFIALRIYRNSLPWWNAVLRSFVATTYVYAHWMPCILASFSQIMFRQETSTWHRTEHSGGTALN